MAEWFEDWFDTKYYHLLYKDRDFSEAESFIEKLVAEIDLKSGARVLDLACGRGRHSIYVNKLGYDTLGVDLSEQSIAFAKTFEKSGLEFLQHDMRDPLPGYEFDAVFNLFTSFGYFDDIRQNNKVIEAVSTYLRQEGHFLIDFMNVNWVERNLEKEEVKTVDGIDFHINRNLQGNYIVKSIEFEDNNKLYRFEEKVQRLSAEDFKKMLAENNFEIVQRFGDYDLNDFNQNNSERLIIHAKKK